MTSLGPHAPYILAAYAITVLVVAGLIGWIVASHRRVKADIAALEGRGIRRRSAGITPVPGDMPGDTR